MQIEGYKHFAKTEQQLLAWYKGKVRTNKIGNMSFESFYNWYLNEATACHYCRLTALQSQLIVRTGKLKSKRFPVDGKYGRGTSRGMWLETDRYDPNGKYELSNIVPCCYFCNNDKSDVFHGDDYKVFIKDRISFMKQLLIKGSYHKNNGQ